MPPSPFFHDYFSSIYAKRLYEGFSGLFKGGTWVPTPLTARELSGTRLSDWWLEPYKELEPHLEGTGKALLAREGPKKELIGLLDDLLAVKDGENAGGPTRGEIANAALNALNRLEKALPSLSALARKDPRSADAVEAFRNACYSVAKGVVVVVENAQRQQSRGESFNRTFNEIFARDAAASLHDLVGDPPKELYMKELYRSDRKGDAYLAWASERMDDYSTIFRDPNRRDPRYEMERWIHQFNEAESELQAGADKAESEKKRNEAMLAVAVNLQELSKKTRNVAVAGATGAGGAAEFSMVAVEAVRQVFGMDARGGVGKEQPLTRDVVEKRKAKGVDAVSRIKEREREDREKGEREERERRR